MLPVQVQMNAKSVLFPLPAPSPLPPPTFSTSLSPSPEAVTSELETITTETNSSGLYPVYSQAPTVDPKDKNHLYDVCDAPGISLLQSPTRQSVLSYIHENYFSPFISATHYRLLSWFYNGNETKSAKDLDVLVQKVLLTDDFDRRELRDFCAAWELKWLDDHMNWPSHLSVEDRWIEGSVKIHLPCTAINFKSEENAPEYSIEPVYYWQLTQVFISSFQEPAAKSFHYILFKLFWKPMADSPPESVISEIYNSDVMIAEHERLQSQPNEPGCNLEKAIVAAFIFSDSTHLTNFRVASLWPGYISLMGKSDEIWASKTIIICSTPLYLHAICKSFLWSIVPQLNILIASQWHWRGLWYYFQKEYHPHNTNTSKTRAYWRNMGAFAWWWVYGSIQILYCGEMCRWSAPLTLSMFFYIWRWLPRKVPHFSE